MTFVRYYDECSTITRELWDKLVKYDFGATFYGVQTLNHSVEKLQQRFGIKSNIYKEMIRAEKIAQRAEMLQRRQKGGNWK